MQCVILAGGRGVRMQPLTDTMPKPLVSVAGEPILAHIIRALPPEVDSLLVVIKYLGDQIRDFLGAEYRGIPVSFVEQGEIDGTGGALRYARKMLKGSFMIMTGDDLHGSTALRVLAQQKSAILVAHSNEPHLFGVVSCKSDGTLESIEEKPQNPRSNLVYTSALMVDERIFEYETPLHGHELYLTDMLSLYARDVPVHVVLQDAWCPVGKPEDVAKAEFFLKEGSINCAR